MGLGGNCWRWDSKCCQNLHSGSPPRTADCLRPPEENRLPYGAIILVLGAAMDVPRELECELRFDAFPRKRSTNTKAEAGA